jgi:hypothetical protein
VLPFATQTGGDTVSFWEDIIDGVIHSEKFSHLLQFARDPTISLFAMRTTYNLLNCFRIPMTRAAYNEFLDLQAFLNYLPPISPSSKDAWHLIWGQRRFLSSHFYQYQFRELTPVEQFLTFGKPNASRGSSFLPGYFSMIGWILETFWEEEGKCWMKDTIV